MQIMQVLKLFEHLLPELNFCYLIGGDKLEFDIERINEKGANVVVATTGRLYDLAINHKALSFHKLEMLIMDEADKLIESSNEVHMNTILSILPKQRRTGLFSATMPSQLKSFIKIGMRNPYSVDVKMDVSGNTDHLFASSTKNNAIIMSLDSRKEALVEKKLDMISELPRGLKNYYLSVPSQKEKLGTLVNFVNNTLMKNQRMIVFFGTCASVNFHYAALKLVFQQ